MRVGIEGSGGGGGGGGGGVCVLLIIETRTVYEDTITAFMRIAI